MVSVALSLRRRPLWADCWDDVMIAGRHPTGFGNTPTYHPVNRLAVPEAAMRLNQKSYFHPIMKQGQWVVKKLNFSLNDSVTIRTRVTGVGMGYLYASFDNGEGPTLLTIKKVTPGFHDLNFKVPYPTLKGFRVGISTTSPKGYTIDRLSKEDRYRLSTNSMMVSQSAPMYESPSIGFAGLGALLDHTGPAKGGEDSAKNPYWDGNFDNFSWKNGFTGDPAKPFNTSDTNTPRVQGSYHGYYAHRASYALAKFDEQESFLGWDMVEQKGYGLPAGVPICMVMQFFVLPKKTKSGGNKAGAADREMKDPYWKYAHDYQIPASDFHLVSDVFSDRYKIKSPPSTDFRPSKKNGPIFQIGRYPVVSTEYDNSGFEVNGDYRNVRDIAAKVEWYNESNGSWSSPTRAPPSIPMTNENGLTKVIFRLPRQLSKVTDKDMLAELTTLGVDYSYEANKHNIPSLNNLKETPSDSFTLIGRPLPDDSKIEFTEDGINYKAVSKATLKAWFSYGTHPYAGRAGNEKGGPKPGHYPVNTNTLNFSDPEKMARMNNPELLNAFYPVGGFKTGGVIIAIGRGMGMRSHFVMKNTGSGSTDGYYVNNTNPATDGSRIGNYDGDVLKPAGIILSTDLEDDRIAIGEEAVLAAWKAKFGQPLTTQFFSDYSFKDQDKTKPTHYKVKDVASGLMIQAPYQIIYFKIGPEYSGPYVDYEIVTEEETKDGETFNVTKLKITQPEGKRFALGKGDSLWLHCRTYYAKYTKQNIDIIEEVEEQRVLKEAGLTDLDTLVYNPLNEAPEENTAAAAEAAQEAQKLVDLALLEPGTPGVTIPESPKPKLPRGAKYVRSEDKWKLNPKYYARKSQLRDAGFLGGIKGTLAGFTNSRDFYVEDVTQKWGASNISGLGDIPFIDSSEENLEDIWRDVGDVTEAAANITRAGAEATYHVFERNYGEVANKGAYMAAQATRIPYNAAQLNRNAGAFVTSSVGEGAADLVNDVADSLGGYSSNGLGDGWDKKAADVGEGVGKFVRGTARGIAPEALTEGIDEGISELTGRFTANPLPYTLLVGGALIMVTPLGGFLARNLITLGGGMIKLMPEVAKAIPESIGGVASGITDSSKILGNTIAGTSSRGTAARRRRNKRR